jgi:AraC-like DNA-binding protein
MLQIDEIADILKRHQPHDGFEPTVLPRLQIVRSSRTTAAVHSVYRPTLCLVAQGRKQVAVGAQSYAYDAAKYLVVSVDLPIVGSIIEASPEQPYLCVVLDIDVHALSELMIGRAALEPEISGPGLGISEVEPGLLDAVLRLVRLLDAPQDAEVLAPLAEREILYRLLMGGQAAMLRRIAAAESRLSQISRAISWLKDNFAGPLSVTRLAADVGMSPSSFHSHFKAVTSMSPLQYRTRLRLQEARRLMVAEAMDAASAGFRVGYESPSQFSRDYGRLFGAPPLKDALRLRGLPDWEMAA